MPIYKGADKVFEISLGGTPVTEVFRGATKIWPEAAPVVSIAPTSGTGLAGTVINFTATATGAAITYQWNIDGAPVSGQTGTTYAHTIAGNVSITCTVTDGYGQSTVSNAAPITQQAAVAVSIAPTSGAGYAGNVINFTATASGGSGTYTYQWKANGTNIGGATAATYAHTIAGNTSITCVATSSGSSATSNAAAITQYAAVTASIAPTSYTGVEGTGTTFTATPGGGSGTYTYLWYKNGASTGIATATYAYTGVLGDTSVYCAVTSSGQTVNSNTATLTISPAVVDLPDEIANQNPAIWFKWDEIGAAQTNYGWYGGTANNPSAGNVLYKQPSIMNDPAGFSIKAGTNGQYSWLQSILVGPGAINQYVDVSDAVWFAVIRWEASFTSSTNNIFMELSGTTPTYIFRPGDVNPRKIFLNVEFPDMDISQSPILGDVYCIAVDYNGPAGNATAYYSKNGGPMVTSAPIARSPQTQIGTKSWYNFGGSGTTRPPRNMSMEHSGVIERRTGVNVSAPKLIESFIKTFNGT